MLLTRRMERLGLRPLGSSPRLRIAIWGVRPVDGVSEPLRRRHAGRRSRGVDGRELADEAHLPQLRRGRRPDRAPPSRPGEDRPPGTFSADLIYDVLRNYQPDHVLLRAARAEAAAGLTDIRRLADLLVGSKGRIRHVRLDRISPFAVSIIAGIGREFVPATCDEFARRGRGGPVAEADGAGERWTVPMMVQMALKFPRGFVRRGRLEASATATATASSAGRSAWRAAAHRRTAPLRRAEVPSGDRPGQSLRQPEAGQRCGVLRLG